MNLQRPVTIGVASRRSGIPAWRLRAWEEAGLLQPKRTPKGYRLYDEDDLALAAKLAAEHAEDRMALVGLEHAALGPDEPQPNELRPDGPRSNEPQSSVSQSSTPVRNPPRAAEGEAPPAIPVDSPLPHRSARRSRRAVREPVTQDEVAIVRMLVNGLQRGEDPSEIYDVALECALQAAHTDIGSLSAVDASRQQYLLLASEGLSKRYIEGIEAWRLQEGFAGRAFSQRSTIVVGDLQEDRYVTREVVRAEGGRAYACVPLLRGQRRLGILQVYGREPNCFEPEQIALLELIAAMVAPSLEIADLQGHVDALQDERTRTFREWVTQVTAGAHQERLETANHLDEHVQELRKDDGAARSVANSLELLAAQIRGGRDEQIDLLPLIRSNIVNRLAKLHTIKVALDVGEWPRSLPSGHVSRLYLIILSLAESAAALAHSFLRIRFDTHDGTLVVRLADDRESPFAGIKNVPIAPNTRTTTKNLGASIQLDDANGDESVAILVTVPRSSFEIRGDALTVRERHVLEALRLGASNRGIATELGISVKTLQNHLSALYRKLGVASRAQAIEFADRSVVREQSWG